MVPKAKSTRQNFCFITFEKEETAKKLLKMGKVNLNGKEVPIAEPRKPRRRSERIQGGNSIDNIDILGTKLGIKLGTI